MPKFYVRSGDLRTIIDRPSPEKAAHDSLRALEKKPVKRLSSITIVSEHGMGQEAHADDIIFTTLDLLEDLGMLDQFRPTDWI